MVEDYLGDERVEGEREGSRIIRVAEGKTIRRRVVARD
jgi:hypothetical protein